MKATHACPGPLRIGNLRLCHRVVPAPMAGYTDAALRLLFREYGAGIVFSEMVNAVGLVRGSSRTERYLDTLPGEAPVAAHLYGSDPVALAEAAAFVENTGRFAAVDLNAGCPVRKIVTKGAGAALMRDPALLGKIVSAMRSATKLPLLVKTRIGLSPREGPLPGLIERIAGAGADAVTIHARYAACGHGGEPDLKALAEARRRVTIPVIGNGGVDSGARALSMMGETGVDGIMIGRALLGAPWRLRGVIAELEGERVSEPPSCQERSRGIQRHFALQLRLAQAQGAVGDGRLRHRLSPGQVAVMRFRPHLARYLRGMHGVGTLRKSLNGLRSPEEVREVIEAGFQASAKKNEKYEDERCEDLSRG